MKTLTYNLQNYDYYTDIKIFTDNILKDSEQFLKSFIDDLLKYLKDNSKYYSNNKLRNQKYLKDELKFELLIIGVLWNTYSVKAQISNLDDSEILKELSKYRDHLNPEEIELKNEVDEIRGYLNTLFFLDYNNEIITEETNVETFKKLIKFLEVSSEFNYELKAINQIYNYIVFQEDGDMEQILSKIIKYGKYFAKESKKYLWKYTYNVENYINTTFDSKINKEDMIFCNRTEVEYHLNMVGAEIMNRLFREGFENRSRKAVLVPGCMKIDNKKCKAKEERLGEVCKVCDKNCNVGRITKKGLKECFETYIISHESSAFKNVNKKDKEDLGIVGVACVLNLISGGWKAESLGIPPQCVIIDYVGCSNHWDTEGFPTNINCKELEKILSIN